MRANEPTHWLTAVSRQARPKQPVKATPRRRETARSASQDGPYRHPAEAVSAVKNHDAASQNGPDGGATGPATYPCGAIAMGRNQPRAPALRLLFVKDSKTCGSPPHPSATATRRRIACRRRHGLPAAARTSPAAARRPRGGSHQQSTFIKNSIKRHNSCNIKDFYLNLHSLVGRSLPAARKD